MKLIEDICIIPKINISVLEKEFTHYPPGVHYSFLIDQTNYKDICGIYKYVHEKGSEIKFSLTFNLSSFDLQIISPFDIAAFFFLPNYKLLNDTPVVHLLPYQNESLGLVRDLLLNISIRQGFGGLVSNELTLFNYFDYTKAEISQDEKVSALRGIVFGQNWLDDQEFFVGASVISNDEIYDFIYWVEQYEKELYESNPQFFSLLALKRKLQYEVLDLKGKVQNLSERLNNEKTYNALLKENHQAKLLQEYYDHEYEVLPTWFKRFGHIIKIITGKRRLHL